MTETKTTKAYRTWVERLSADTMTKGHIDSFRQIVCPLADGEHYGKKSTLTSADARELVELAETRFKDGGYKITEEHAAMGLAWLKSTSTSDRDGYGMPKECVELFDHFMWAGIEPDGNAYRTTYAPIYRIVLTDGTEIDYNTQPWQSGSGVDFWIRKQGASGWVR